MPRSMRTVSASVLPRLARGQRGSAIAELLVACIVGTVLVGAALTVYLVALRGEQTTATRAGGLDRAHVAVERMTRELRQGGSIASSTINTIVFETYVRGMSPPQRRVRYDCSEASTCTRAVAPTGTNTFGTPVRLVTGLDPTVPVFTVTGTKQVTVDLKLRDTTDAAASRTLNSQVSDGATLRNAP